MGLDDFRKIADAAMHSIPLPKLIAIHVLSGAKGYLGTATR
jgi:hypothetical protein